MKIERLNLAAVPCRQRPKRAPEARRRPNGSVLQWVSTGASMAGPSGSTSSSRSPSESASGGEPSSDGVRSPVRKAVTTHQLERPGCHSMLDGSLTSSPDRRVAHLWSS